MKAQHVPDVSIRPVSHAVHASKFSGVVQPAQALSMAAKAAKTLTETATKQTLTSAVRQNGFLKGLKRYFSDPAKVAIWTPGLLHVPGTTIQPFFTWLALKQSGVDQGQVNTLTQMEIVRSLTSHAMNLATSIAPVALTEIFNQNVAWLNKSIKFMEFKKATTLQQLGGVILANALTFGVIRPFIVTSLGAKTVLKTTPKTPATLPTSANNQFTPMPSVGMPYSRAFLPSMPLPAGAPFFGRTPFVMPPPVQGPAIVPFIPASLSTMASVR